MVHVPRTGDSRERSIRETAEGAEIRWVSYHFHADPELVLPDEDLIELLATLTGAAPADSSAPPTG